MDALVVTEEQNWEKYTGTCIIFVGTHHTLKDEEDEDSWAWALETEEETAQRLTEALAKEGIICENITINWTDDEAAQRSCTCECYSKTHYVYEHLYIQDLTTYEFGFGNKRCPMEFCIVKCDTDEYVLK
jgi:hypothetical protein